MTATMKLEMQAGTAIETASADAQRVADLLGVNVEFDFNEVRCLALPGCSAEVLAEAFMEEVGRELTHPYDSRFACSRPKQSPPPSS